MRQRTKSNSTSSTASIVAKFKYNLGLFILRWRSRTDAVSSALVPEVDDIVRRFQAVSGNRAKEATVLEIGFGARPLRSRILARRFSSVTAIDLDAPVLAAVDLVRVLKTNGFQRFLKSAIRYFIFDRSALQRFDAELARLSGGESENLRLVIGDASEAATWRAVGRQKFDLIFSTDVFEHIPSPDVANVIGHCLEHLAPNGHLMIRPMVYTGISGGHDLRWYPDRVASNDSEGAWHHLSDANFSVDTYLNHLTRRDYVRIFEAAGLDVLRDEALLGDLGRQHVAALSASVREKFDDYELFSNRVEFLLRPRR